MKVPKTLGGCADKLYTLREKRLALQKQIDVIKKDESVLKDTLIRNLSTADAKGITGKRARVKLNIKRIASVKDWPAFYKHVLKTKDFSLMQRRASDAAINERWNDNKTVPGVEPFDVIKVSLTKVG